MQSFAVIGDGVMGRGAALQLAEKGVKVLLLGHHQEKLDLAIAEDSSGNLYTSLSHTEMADFFKDQPKIVGLFVPAGNAILKTLDEILPSLKPGDLVLDFSNNLETASKVTQERIQAMGIPYFTCGISGGEYGARHGAAIMWSGPEEHKALVEPVIAKLCAISSHGPAIGYFGETAEGHMVKTMHNGIEYTLLAILGELYAYGKHIHSDMSTFFRDITPESISGYLTDLAQTVCSQMENDERLIEKIKDTAGQKGTGQFALIKAFETGKPFIGIASALSARYSSAQHGFWANQPVHSPDLSVEELKRLFEYTYILAHLEGLSILFTAGVTSYELMATTWSAGCILSGNMLDTLLTMLEHDKAPFQSQEVALYLATNHPHIKKTLLSMAEGNMPTTMLSLVASIETEHTRPMYTNFVQAMRDAFGGHTVERTDQEGTFHYQW